MLAHLADVLAFSGAGPDIIGVVAKAAGQSLSAYLREQLDTLAGKPKRELGTLAHLGPVGEPLDGWGPMSEDELALWEGSESYDPHCD